MHAADGGELRAGLVVRAAAARCAPTLASAVVVAAAMIPFVALGNVPGNEIANPAAVVILGGLLTTVLWSLLTAPRAVLRGWSA